MKRGRVRFLYTPLEGLLRTSNMSCTVQYPRVFNANDRPLVAPDYQVAMTLEDFVGTDVCTGQKLAGQALEELLLEAQKQGAVTVGVYEAAKLLNV